MFLFQGDEIINKTKTFLNQTNIRHADFTPIKIIAGGGVKRSYHDKKATSFYYLIISTQENEIRSYCTHFNFARYCRNHISISV